MWEVGEGFMGQKGRAASGENKKGQSWWGIGIKLLAIV